MGQHTISSLKLDRPLGAEQLANKYDNNANGRGEHPVFTRCDWRMAVEEQENLNGYWTWVVSEIDSELDAT